MRIFDDFIKGACLGKSAGELAWHLFDVVNELRPISSDECRRLLRNCLAEPDRAEEFMLPPHFFPGTSHTHTSPAPLTMRAVLCSARAHVHGLHRQTRAQVVCG